MLLTLGAHAQEGYCEIKHVAWLIKDAAEKTLPHFKPRRIHRFKDRMLSRLCAKSKEAWRAWCEDGRPSDGPLYEAKCSLRNEVRRRIRLCSAIRERKKVQQRENLFKTNAHSHCRFHTPQNRGKSRCTRLRVNGALLSDPTQLLEAWTNHFQNLAKSQLSTREGLQQESTSMLSSSFQKEELFLDCPFSTDEVALAINRMKLKKSPGPDNLTSEHFRFSGYSVVTWLTEVLNFVVELEQLPSSLKSGITIPVYKGGGKDPLDLNSYRGIILNSVISKILESLILDRLNPLFTEAGLPHPNQSAYRKGVSCADAIFATQEIINRYIQEGSRVYMCLYYLQKAFDSVEIPVLLGRLFQAGVNSKTWRLLRSWYEDCSTSIRLGQHLSTPFALERGVRQGSILSPSLFLLVMDPLLRQLQSLSIGASVNNMFAGGFLHADDIRTLANNSSSMEAQIATVRKFANDNFLTLNASKCEIVIFEKLVGKTHRNIDVDFPMKNEGKCLGYTWSSNLSSLPMIKERI